MGKQYIPVLVYIDESGKITPKHIKAGYDNEWIKIVKVTDFRRRASLRAGAIGIRYSCVVDIYGELKEIYLYDEGQKWFLETED